MNKKILLLAANPKDTTRLRLDEEFREIDERLRLSKQRDHFEIKQKSAVRIKDLQLALLDEQPHIVHFSGHGELEGIMLEDQSGKATLVNPKGLSGLFKILADDGIECVVLNACYSETQAKAIGEHIPFVISMRKEIGDKAAIEFSVGFYNGIGAGKSVEQSYRLGCNAIQLQNIPEHLTPVLMKKSDFLTKSNKQDNDVHSDKILDVSVSEQELKKVHVDRAEEKKSFKDMIHRNVDAHILLIEAEVGMGKTNLLNQFRTMSQHLKRAHVDFKDRSLSFGKILGELSHQLGENSFKIFNQQCRQFVQKSGLNTEHTLLIVSQIDVVLEELSRETRANQRQMITDAFFLDLDAIYEIIQKPIVLLFDNYDMTSNDVNEWISNQFIARVRRYPWLICVFAGEKTPRIDMDWNDTWCLQHKLEPLEIDDVREYIQTIRLEFSEDVIKVLTKLSHGKPQMLKSIVLDLISGGNS